jgi:hypothetical protein
MKDKRKRGSEHPINDQPNSLCSLRISWSLWSKAEKET